MNFDEYKQWQPKFASYEINKFPEREGQSQAIKEMVSEAGEVLGILTKADRKGKEIPREKIVDELGDTLWGVVGIMNKFDISMDELIEFNVNKLEDRFKNDPGKWR